MTSSTLSVAVAQPAIRSHDLGGNAAAHAEAVRRAQARLIVFPELSLTGYELEADAVALSDSALEPIIAACRETNAVALAGAPIIEGDRAFIATIRIDRSGVRAVYRKTWVHGQEHQRFTPGPGPEVTEIDGWTVGLAICKDTGASQHTAQLGRRGVDLYAAGVVDLPEDVIECESRCYVIARALRAPVAVASFAGATGGAFTSTAGHSAIYDSAGERLAGTDAHPGRIAVADLVR